IFIRDSIRLFQEAHVPAKNTAAVATFAPRLASISCKSEKTTHIYERMPEEDDEGDGRGGGTDGAGAVGDVRR
ncbi:MAG: hypothetical protein K2K36_05225, partial [Muribaculaceae bacterium]|nr:hypothetical protein [Muribaculaceae bacterium]